MLPGRSAVEHHLVRLGLQFLLLLAQFVVAQYLRRLRAVVVV